MASAGFWNDQESARTAVQQVKELKGWIEPYDRLAGRINAALELDELLAAEPDAVCRRRSTRKWGVESDVDAFELRRAAWLTISAMPGWRSARVPAAPRLRTGQKCSCACAGRIGRVRARNPHERGRGAGIRAPCWRSAAVRVRLPPSEPASTGSFGFPFDAQSRRHTASRRCSSIRSSTRKSTSRFATRTSEWMSFARAEPAGST